MLRDGPRRGGASRRRPLRAAAAAAFVVMSQPRHREGLAILAEEAPYPIFPLTTGTLTNVAWDYNGGIAIRYCSCGW